MNLHKDPRIGIRTSAEVFAPAMFGDTPWDVLLALFSDERGSLNLAQLAGMCSVPPLQLTEHLSDLEDRGLVTGRGDASRGEVRAILTAHGRGLLRRYLAASSQLELRERR